jgi:hypothetical protein
MELPRARCQAEFPSIWHALFLGFVDDGIGYFVAASALSIEKSVSAGSPTKVQAMPLKSLGEEAYQPVAGMPTKAAGRGLRSGLFIPGVGRRATAGDLHFGNGKRRGRRKPDAHKLPCAASRHTVADILFEAMS